MKKKIVSIKERKKESIEPVMRSCPSTTSSRPHWLSLFSSNAEFQYTRIFNEHSGGIASCIAPFFLSFKNHVLVFFWILFYLFYYLTLFLVFYFIFFFFPKAYFFLLHFHDREKRTGNQDGSDWNREFIVPRT